MQSKCVQVPLSAMKLPSSDFTNNTGILPNFTILELFEGNTEAIPAFTELTFGLVDFGGIRKESAGYIIVNRPPIPPIPSKELTNFLLFNAIIIL